MRVLFLSLTNELLPLALSCKAYGHSSFTYVNEKDFRRRGKGLVESCPLNAPLLRRGRIVEGNVKLVEEWASPNLTIVSSLMEPVKGFVRGHVVGGKPPPFPKNIGGFWDGQKLSLLHTLTPYYGHMCGGVGKRLLAGVTLTKQKGVEMPEGVRERLLTSSYVGPLHGVESPFLFPLLELVEGGPFALFTGHYKEHSGVAVGVRVSVAPYPHAVIGVSYPPTPFIFEGKALKHLWLLDCDGRGVVGTTGELGWVTARASTESGAKKRALRTVERLRESLPELQYRVDLL